MKNKVIVDTSLLVAQIDEKDIWNERAFRLSEAFSQAGVELIYFDCVINETITVFGRRLLERKEVSNFKKFLKKLEAQIKKEDISWLYPAAKRYYEHCLALIRTYEGKLNFHDALIALAAKEIGLPFIASFDKDFDLLNWLQRISGSQHLPLHLQ